MVCIQALVRSGYHRALQMCVAEPVGPSSEAKGLSPHQHWTSPVETLSVKFRSSDKEFHGRQCRNGRGIIEADIRAGSRFAVAYRQALVPSLSIAVARASDLHTQKCRSRDGLPASDLA